MARDDVTRTLTHMCQFGMTSNIGGKGSELGPVLKPTGFMTNSPCIASQLARVCPGDHKHVHLVGGRAAGAAIYPPGLCRAICRGLAAQLHEDRIGRVRSLAMNENRLLSFSMACRQAMCGDPFAGVELGGKPGLVHAHPSVGALLVGKIGGQSSDGSRPQV